MNNQPILAIVIPCYNEEEVLPITSKLFLEQLNKMIAAGKIAAQSRILFIDDGSKDATWKKICGFAKEDPHFIGIRQSRNRGHQSTLLAGLMEAKTFADITISIDCDGQDDISAMDAMVDAYLDGCDIVYGVRNNRESDTAFKRGSAQFFYKLLKFLGAEVVYNHADYRLLSKKALDAFENFKEVNLFLRGTIPLVGYKSTTVEYARTERMAGKSKYSLGKMFGLAFDGITSLSIKPLRIITALGGFFSLLSFIGILWAIISFFVTSTTPGWASMLCAICFMGGIQLISIGVLGEYIGKIYLETKARPRYIISEKTFED